jgi:hypothetical protein
VDAGEHDLGYAPQACDEGMVVLQQLADDRRDGARFRSCADGLQIAPGAEGAAFALQHQHADAIVGFDLCGELLQLLGDREIDGVEGGRAVEGDGGDRTVDRKQRRIGCGHGIGH